MNTLWTAFFCTDMNDIRSPNPPQFHVTHKYLGEQSDIVESEITSLIVDYFSENPEDKIVPRMEFSKIDFFGENYQRVLCLSNHQFKQYLFLELRKRLDVYRKDDFPEWRPHITTNLNCSKIFVFDYFALMRNNEVVIKFDA